jgi:hypothetical protein
MLEAVAAHASDQFVWRDRLGLVMQSCGEDYSHTDVTRHEIVLCYETAADFAELCREYGKSSQAPILIELPVRSHQRRFGR